MIRIAPSILAADFSCLKEEIRNLEHMGADWIHIDVMDGHFVPNITMGPDIVKAIRAHTSLFLDVHLMIEKPDNHIPAFVRSGADLICVHQEVCPHLDRTLSHIKGLGVKSGVAINPATPVAMIELVLKQVDLVLLMSVNPGFGGQAFLPDVLSKIAQLRQLARENGYNYEIEVDGGINNVSGKQCIESGATVLVAGTYILKAKDRKEAMDSLRCPRE